VFVIENLETSQIADPETEAPREQPRVASKTESSASSELPSHISTPKCSFSPAERVNMRLMHHYTLHASKSIRDITIPKNEDQTLWEGWAAELAMEHDFLMHGLLGISALHIALNSPQQREQESMTVTAIKHHDVGIALFRPYLEHITNANHDAVFAMFCIVFLHSFGVHRSEGTPLERIHQALTLIRDSMAIVKEDYERMQQSRWSALKPPLPLNPALRLPAEVEGVLSILRGRIEAAKSFPSDGEDGFEGAVYTTAIEALRTHLIFAEICPWTASVLTYFPMASGPPYWDLLRTGRPMALAIIANYAVVLHRQRQNIWMATWGKEIVDAVSETLPREWHECITWAVRETNKRED
jgi:hypothetical protein